MTARTINASIHEADTKADGAPAGETRAALPETKPFQIGTGASTIAARPVLQATTAMVDLAELLSHRVDQRR
jgi:hypothetical protein